MNAQRSIPVIDIHEGNSASERIEELITAESLNPIRQYWLSFCDPNAPKGSQFLGVAIVSARGVASAARRAHELGINPGGEIMSLELNNEHFIDSEYCNRLLSKTEAELIPIRQPS